MKIKKSFKGNSFQMTKLIFSKNTKDSKNIDFCTNQFLTSKAQSTVKVQIKGPLFKRPLPRNQVGSH